jgi:hypothetical protein
MVYVCKPFNEFCSLIIHFSSLYMLSHISMCFIQILSCDYLANSKDVQNCNTVLTVCDK